MSVTPEPMEVDVATTQQLPTKALIGGEWVESSGETTEVRSV